jgi:type I restriction enzyme R subunit
MSEKEAKARIKINKLLEEGGRRFFPEGSAPANTCLGDNSEKTLRGGE